jgi:putative ABC transport system ATP-binding protein
LDSHTSLEIMALFQKLNTQGITIVLVTHERDIARFARRILSFHDGRVVADERAAAPVDAVAELAKANSREVAA